LFLSDVKEIRIFQTFWKNTQVSNTMKSAQLELRCSMRTDRQTDRHDEAVVAFRNIANALKK